VFKKQTLNVPRLDIFQIMMGDSIFVKNPQQLADALFLVQAKI
jgi:hypothetical protein